MPDKPPTALEIVTSFGDLMKALLSAGGSPAQHAEEWHWLYVFQSTVGQRIVKYRFEQDVVIRLVSAGISVAIGFQGEDLNTIRNSSRAGTLYPAVLQVGVTNPPMVMYVSIPVSKGTDLYFNNTSATSTCDSYVAYTLR